MAEYIIKADTDAIRATCTKIENQKELMSNYMSEMQKKINELQNYFISDAGREFVSKYSNVSKSIQQCLENLGNEITSLRRAADTFDTVNGKTTQDVNNLSSQSTFTNQ